MISAPPVVPGPRAMPVPLEQLALRVTTVPLERQEPRAQKVIPAQPELLVTPARRVRLVLPVLPGRKAIPELLVELERRVIPGRLGHRVIRETPGRKAILEQPV